jgi:hypothetical protein
MRRGGGGLYGNFVSANEGLNNKAYRGAEIPPPPGQADNFVDVGAGFSKLDEQTAEPQGGELSFQRVGRNKQVPLGSANCPDHSGKPGNVCQFKIDHVGKRNEF